MELLHTADIVLELSLKRDAHSRLGHAMRPFRTGKIPAEALIHHVFRYTGREDPSVILGSSIGEDAALVSFGDKILVMTTDPVTGLALIPVSAWAFLHLYKLLLEIAEKQIALIKTIRTFKVRHRLGQD